MSATLEAEQQLETELLTPINQKVTVAGVELGLYTLPEGSEIGYGGTAMMGIHNPEGFQRIMQDGLSALEDGETVSAARASQYDTERTASEIFTITRHGENFTLRSALDNEPHPRVPSETDEDLVLEGGEGVKRIKGFFGQIAFLSSGNRGLGLIGRGGKRAEVAGAMGFTSEDASSEMPLPQTLQRNITSLQEQGLQIPNVKFFKDGVIDGEEYVSTWANGEFPASEQPGYFAHDLLSEHYRPLVVLREDAMGIAVLYARAVLEQDEITAVLPKDTYQINAEHPEMIRVPLSGREKVDHAAFCLDQFTTELSDFADRLECFPDDDRVEFAFSESPSHSWRYTPQMVETILGSSHRDELLAHLKATGSKAFDEETQTFSYETYTREIFERAQTFWEVEPKAPEPAPKLPEGIF